jgi:hypothetical protein
MFPARIASLFYLYFALSLAQAGERPTEVVGLGSAPLPHAQSVLNAKVIDCDASAGTDLAVVGDLDDPRGPQVATGRVFSVVQVDPKRMRIEFNSDNTISTFYWNDASKSFEKRDVFKLVSEVPDGLGAIYEFQYTGYGIARLTTIALNRRLGTAIVTTVFPVTDAGASFDDPHFQPWSNSTFFSCLSAATITR